MKQIPLTKGQFAIVDDEDYEALMQSKWYAKKNRNVWYAAGYLKTDDGKRTYTTLHKLLTGCPKGMVVDHANGDGLDNRRCNIRVCTPLQNSLNKKQRWGRSKYKGVWWDKIQNKWEAGLRHNNKRIYLGRYKNEEDAALAYNKKALELHGEFANLNIIAAMQKGE